VIAPASSARDVAGWLRSVLSADAALVADSRAVRPGDAFFAYPGERSDGRRFIHQAIASGAAAIVLEQDGWQHSAQVTVPHHLTADLKQLCGPIADVFYGCPSERLQVIAVTGTNGKTSCTQWIAQGLSAMGTPGAVIGTLGAGVPGGLSDFGLTTPDALALQALFAGFEQQGFEAVAIEASSIGLHQHRIDGTRIAVAVHTNLTRDHLDYHGTMQAYAQAKARLFAWPGLRCAVVNLDDPWSATMLQAKAPGVASIGYRIADDQAPANGPLRVDRELVAVSVRYGSQGMLIELDGDWGPAQIESQLIGRFNVSNLLAVACTWLALGHTLDQVAHTLQRLLPVPGRLQPVAAPEGVPAPLVVVDYAHTPDALANALAALRPIATARNGRLWCVFGAGGDRDPGKRELMGQVAARDADQIVLTSDNPRSESPERILDAIALGLGKTAALRLSDRAQAIDHALGDAQDEDVVLIAGKGHEAYQEIAGVRHAFDDRICAQQALVKRAHDRRAHRV